MADQYHLSVDDVDNAFKEHMAVLDEQWPDAHGDDPGMTPRKVQIVEWINAIRLRLHQRAQKNMDRYESPFEKAAKKITGAGRGIEKKAGVELPVAPSDAETAARAVKSRIAAHRNRDGGL